MVMFCVRCGRVLECVKNGVEVKVNHGAYAHADLYRCPSCGFEIVTGLGSYYPEPETNNPIDLMNGERRPMTMERLISELQEILQMYEEERDNIDVAEYMAEELERLIEDLKKWRGE